MLVMVVFLLGLRGRSRKLPPVGTKAFSTTSAAEEGREKRRETPEVAVDCSHHDVEQGSKLYSLAQSNFLLPCSNDNGPCVEYYLWYFEWLGSAGKMNVVHSSL